MRIFEHNNFPNVSNIDPFCYIMAAPLFRVYLKNKLSELGALDEFILAGRNNALRQITQFT
jgi:hypothetical protein